MSTAFTFRHSPLKYLASKDGISHRFFMKLEVWFSSSALTTFKCPYSIAVCKLFWNKFRSMNSKFIFRWRDRMIFACPFLERLGRMDSPFSLRSKIFSWISVHHLKSLCTIRNGNFYACLFLIIYDTVPVTWKELMKKTGFKKRHSCHHQLLPRLAYIAIALLSRKGRGLLICIMSIS